MHAHSVKQQRNGLKSWGHEVTIFRQAAGNF